MKPQEPIPHNYPMRKLNLIFALTSLGLLAVTGVMVMYDYVRGWKWFQLEFNRIQAERIQQELTSKNDAETRKRLAGIERDMKAGQVEIARNRNAYLEAQKALDEWEGKHYAADQNYRFAKAVLDAKRYELEAATVQHRHDVKERQREYDTRNAHLAQLNLTLQEVTRNRDAARARVDTFLKRIKQLEDQKKDLTANADLLNKQLRGVAMSSDNMILNAPMLDFINPTLKIDQVVLNDLFIEMNYMSVPRVDRCMTCHRAIDRPGFESKKEAERLAAELQTKLDRNLVQPSKRAEMEARVAALRRIVDGPRDMMNPFRTHPKLDTFVGSSSPHPLLEMGCTVCHRGQDRATEFGRAGHTPMSLRMEQRWKKSMPFFPSVKDYEKRNWGYEVNPFLDTPMYPREHSEAGCLKCHSGQMEVGEGEKINKATHMVELYGCHACHKISNWRFTDLQKPGPSLEGIAEKTTPAFAFRWIANPTHFRPTTRMPSFFYQRNMIGPDVSASERAQNIKYQDAEIHAIVTYLFSKSTHRAWSAPTGGDAARGKELVNSIGCMGCHIAQDTVKDEKTGVVRVAKRDDFPLERHFGFNLTGVGSKTNPAWIFNWVKNPKAYDPLAPMPSLRLSESEAADITAYLMSLQKPRFMQEPVRPPSASAVRELAKAYLVNTLTDVDANTKLRSMSDHDQLVYLGQRSIEKYGCYSCHDIKGFDGLKPIGTELTVEGSKTLHLFDFGFAHDYEAHDGKHEHILHTVPSWVYTKVRSPRVYDDKRAKPYNDKLKMPNFHLSPEEAQLVTSVVLGLTKEKVSENRLASRDARHRAVEEMRKIVSQRNCRACHVVNRAGRAIGPMIADTNFLPPDLTPQGGRAQSPWLFSFLKDPTVMKIRPWMNVRMPTFGFSDHEAATIVSGFAAEGNEPQFETMRYEIPPQQNVAIGREVYAMLRCAQCHSTTPVDPANPPLPNVADAQSLAPNLTLSKLRLRHDWIADWIRRPGEMIPDTRMPANFPRDPETGGFRSPLAGAIDTPQFAGHKAALLPYFANEEALRKTMGDAVALTNYLRDYIWSVGLNQMRNPGAGPVTPAPQPQPVTPPAPVQQTARAGSR